MDNMRTYLDILNESLYDWNNGQWVHYSDHPMLALNPHPRNQDPVAIYFFPESFPPYTPMWKNKNFKYIVSLKSDVKILDWGSLIAEQIDELLLKSGGKAEFDALAVQFPPKDRKDILKRVWNCMRNSMVLGNGGGRAKWNMIFRNMGFDAVFDDTGSIHNAEVQLMILNPRCIAKVDRQSTSRSGYNEIKKVLADMIELCKPYGELEIEQPKKMSDTWGSSRKGDPKFLIAKIAVSKSKEVYANFKITYNPNETYRKHLININLQYSRPSLNYGVGAEYDMNTSTYDKYSGIANLKDSLDKIFSTELTS